MDESQEKKEAPTIMEQMGGVSGLISSTLPILILIPVNARWGLMPALMAAMGVACGVFLVAHHPQGKPAAGIFGTHWCGHWCGDRLVYWRR